MRWTALVLIASMMFFGYMFVDVMSPIQALMESQRGWTPDVFGTYAAMIPVKFWKGCMP